MSRGSPVASTLPYSPAVAPTSTLITSRFLLHMRLIPMRKPAILYRASVIWIAEARVVGKGPSVPLQRFS